MTIHEICSIIIAVCALGFTGYQVIQTRKHNRISCKPSLHTDISRKSVPEGYEITYTVKNSGLGPAIIDSVELFANRKPFKSDDRHFRDLADVLFKDIPHRVTYDGWLDSDYSLPEKESYIYCKVLFPSDYTNKDSVLDEALDRADIIIRYKSFYGDELVLNSFEDRD